MALLKLACAIFLCMMVVAPQAKAAITCATVSKSLVPCIAYLEGGSTPSSACCIGVKTLNSLASTPADRRTACGCLKSAATSFEGIDFAKAAQLPTKCSVNIGYTISPNIDCSKYISTLSVSSFSSRVWKNVLPRKEMIFQKGFAICLI